MVAQSIVLHVDSDQIVEPGGGEAQNARYLLGVKEIRRLVPVDPHAAQVVTKEIVQRIPRQKTQTVRDPVCLVWIVEEVRLDSLP